jgi:hypothetical protein
MLVMYCNYPCLRGPFNVPLCGGLCGITEASASVSDCVAVPTVVLMVCLRMRDACCWARGAANVAVLCCLRWCGILRRMEPPVLPPPSLAACRCVVSASFARWLVM